MSSPASGADSSGLRRSAVMAGVLIIVGIAGIKGIVDIPLGIPVPSSTRLDRARGARAGVVPLAPGALYTVQRTLPPLMHRAACTLLGFCEKK